MGALSFSWKHWVAREEPAVCPTLVGWEHAMPPCHPACPSWLLHGLQACTPCPYQSLVTPLQVSPSYFFSRRLGTTGREPGEEVVLLGEPGPSQVFVGTLASPPLAHHQPSTPVCVGPLRHGAPQKVELTPMPHSS